MSLCFANDPLAELETKLLPHFSAMTLPPILICRKPGLYREMPSRFVDLFVLATLGSLAPAYVFSAVSHSGTRRLLVVRIDG